VSRVQSPAVRVFRAVSLVLFLILTSLEGSLSCCMQIATCSTAFPVGIPACSYFSFSVQPGAGHSFTSSYMQASSLSAWAHMSRTTSLVFLPGGIPMLSLIAACSSSSPTGVDRDRFHSPPGFHRYWWRPVALGRAVREKVLSCVLRPKLLFSGFDLRCALLKEIPPLLGCDHLVRGGRIHLPCYHSVSCGLDQVNVLLC
jgi:hypothetical protein